MTDWKENIKSYTFAEIEGKKLTMHIGYDGGIYYIFGREDSTGDVYLLNEHPSRID